MLDERRSSYNQARDLFLPFFCVLSFFVDGMWHPTVRSIFPSFVCTPVCLSVCLFVRLSGNEHPEPRLRFLFRRFMRMFSLGVRCRSRALKM